jgi:glycosyltransferase involved in cell wall biosynthesis
MTKRGHQVTVICPGDNTEVVKMEGFKVIRVKSYSIKLTELMKTCFKDPDYLENLEDFSDYNLIHLQSPFTICAMGFLIALKHNIPVSATFHTNVADFATTFLNEDVLSHENKNFFYRMLLSNKFVLGGTQKAFGALAWKFVKNFYNAVPNCTVPARFCKKLLRDKKVKNEINVINNPVNPSKSKKDYSKKYDFKDKFIILHVGRLSSEKRVENLINIVAKLKKKIPNILGVICSDGLLRSDLEKLAKKLKVKDNILFTGFIKRDELSWIYEKSSIVTAFGLYETFNLCACEGLFYGKPLVLSDSGPHAELIEENGFAITVDENEIDNFAKKIQLIHDDKKMYMKFSGNSKKHWKNYDYSMTLQKHEDYFVNSSKNNYINNKNYANFIKYLAYLSVCMNTLLLSQSLKERKDNGLIDEFDKFSKVMNSQASKLKKSF